MIHCSKVKSSFTYTIINRVQETAGCSGWTLDMKPSQPEQPAAGVGLLLSCATTLHLL